MENPAAGSPRPPVGAMTPGAPLYKEVKRQLTESLRNGEWKPGEVIASEKLLVTRFGVSLGTLRKAVDELVAEKVLIRHQGRGTFVASHENERQFFYFFDIARPDGDKDYPKVELLSFTKGRADATLARKLGIETGAAVFRFVNRLFFHGVAAMIDEIEVPEALFPGLSKKRLLERPHTVYHFYQQQFGVSVIRTEEMLSAVLCNAAQAGILGIAEAAPLLCVQRVAYSYRDQAVEVRRSFVDTRAHVYLAQRGRSASDGR